MRKKFPAPTTGNLTSLVQSSIRTPTAQNQFFTHESFSCGRMENTTQNCKCKEIDCLQCGKRGHIVRACPTKNSSKLSCYKHRQQPAQHRLSKTYALEEEKEAMLYNTSASHARGKFLMVEPKINGAPIQMELDTFDHPGLPLQSPSQQAADLPNFSRSINLQWCNYQTAWGHLCGRRVQRPAPCRQGSQCEDRWTSTVCKRLASASPNQLERCTPPRQQHCINIVLPQRVFLSASLPILQGTTTSRQWSQTTALEGPTTALHTSRQSRNGAESP